MYVFHAFIYTFNIIKLGICDMPWSNRESKIHSKNTIKSLGKLIKMDYHLMCSCLMKVPKWKLKSYLIQVFVSNININTNFFFH